MNTPEPTIFHLTTSLSEDGITPADRVRIANHMRLRMDVLEAQEARHLAHARDARIRKAKLVAQMKKAFPDIDPTPLPATWSELTQHERATLYFITVHGRIRRIPVVLAGYAALTGEEVSEAAFRMRLSRLQHKGALEHGHLGYFVADHLLLVTAHQNQSTPAYENLATLQTCSRCRRSGGGQRENDRGRRAGVGVPPSGWLRRGSAFGGPQGGTGDADGGAAVA